MVLAFFAAILPRSLAIFRWKPAFLHEVCEAGDVWMLQVLAEAGFSDPFENPGNFVKSMVIVIVNKIYGYEYVWL